MWYEVHSGSDTTALSIPLGTAPAIACKPYVRQCGRGSCKVAQDPYARGYVTVGTVLIDTYDTKNCSYCHMKKGDVVL